MNKPTPGKWLIDERTGIIVIYEGPENTEPCIDGIPNDRRVAVFRGHYIEAEGRWEMSPEQIGTAHLILAAVNACFAVNPSNPLAVAEALPGLASACAEALVGLNQLDCGSGTLGDTLRAALAALEAKP